MSVQSEHGGARSGEEEASISRGERKQQGQAEASTAARVPAAGMACALNGSCAQLGRGGRRGAPAGRQRIKRTAAHLRRLGRPPGSRASRAGRQHVLLRRA